MEHLPAAAAYVRCLQGLETVSYLWVVGLSGSAVFAAQHRLDADL